VGRIQTWARLGAKFSRPVQAEGSGEVKQPHCSDAPFNALQLMAGAVENGS
jgi:hypothetical protein